MSTSSSSLFSGTSRFSTDFQAVVDRAVAIASLPLTQLSQHKSELDTQSQALGSLETRMDAVRSAVANLKSATGANSWSASVSDSTSVKVTASEGASEGSHTIEVTSMGSYTSTASEGSVTDPVTGNISGAATFTLTVDGKNVPITPEAGTLSSLVAAINTAGLDVRAAAVNIGTASAPDYRLAVQGTKLASTSIQLEDSGGALLDTLATGSTVTYKLDGSAITLKSETRTVEIARGVTAQLLRKSDPGVETAISVSRSTSAVAALSSFVSAYNAAMTELDTHRGKGNGALAGQSIVRETADALRRAAQYTATGDVPSLAALGVEADQDGRVSFDQTDFQAAASQRPDALASFLDGFLSSASTALDASVIDSEKDSVAAQTKTQQDRIDAEQTRIDDLRNSLVAQMSAADALIASLEQQANYVTNLFQSMRVNSQLYG